MTARSRLSGGLVALASLLLPAVTLAGYARLTLLDSDQFAARATASVRDASVRSLIADRVTDEVILRHQADLVSARPIISSAISGIVGGGAFASLFRRAVLDTHRAVIGRDQDTITLTLADVGTVAVAALKQVKPAWRRRSGTAAGSHSCSAASAPSATWPAAPRGRARSPSSWPR